MPRMHSVVRGTGTPKDKDEVNKRDACEWDGWVCERDVIGVSSIFKLTHRAAALPKILPIFTLSCPRKAARLKWKVPRFDCAGWTPEAAKKRSVSWWACKNSSGKMQIAKNTPHFFLGRAAFSFCPPTFRHKRSYGVTMILCDCRWRLPGACQDVDSKHQRRPSVLILIFTDRIKMTFFCAGSSESGKEGRFLARMSSGWQACYCTLLHAMVLVLVAGIRSVCIFPD